MDEEAPAISETGARIRPLGIVVVALLSVGRVLIETTGLLLPETTGPLAAISGGSTIPDFPANTPEWFLAQAATIALIILTAASVVGLWRLRAWGWSLALIIAGVVLVLDLGWWYTGQPRYIGMFLNMIVVFYLNQRDVRTIFLPSSI
jgi:ABC-type phosphate transport system permease subunit